MGDFIELIGNSGVLMKYRGINILIDGIFTGGAHFSPLPREMKKAVFGMASAYRDIEYLLFTHRHIDHFSLEYLKEYLRHNQVSSIYLPQAQQDEWDELECKGMLEDTFSGVMHNYEGAFGGYTQEHLSEDITLRFHRSTHMGGAAYEKTIHYMIELLLDGDRYLFVADADAREENLSCIPADGKTKMIFVNPLFFQNPKGQKILKELQPENIVIYHLPFAEDDSSGLRELARTAVAQAALSQAVGKIKDVILFCEQGQRLQIG